MNITGKDYDIRSSKTIITLKGNSLKISRRGFTNRINHGNSGYKEFDITSISSVQVKKPTFFTKGFIQFTFPGSSENKKGLTSAITDENSVIYTKTDEDKIQEIKKYIDAIIYNVSEPQQSMASSAADEIKKLKELLDQDILTQEEFDAKKKQILGL